LLGRTLEYMSPSAQLAIFFYILSNGEDLAIASGPLPIPKGHDLSDLEFISRTPLQSTPSDAQIGFALPQPLAANNFERDL